MSLLEYEKQIFLDVFHTDSLVVMARGLGVDRILFNFIQLYCDPGSLVIILNCNSLEVEHYMEMAVEANVDILPKEITSELSNTERSNVYLEGGVLFITSRILVVDMLTNRLPINLVTGILVYRAHKIIESCQEAFILRLYRKQNKTGFIKAFSDQPNAFVGDICKVDRVMKNLYAKKLFLWPRFHAVINTYLQQHQPEVVEVRVPMTISMKSIQSGILDIISACINELKKCAPSLDADTITVETAISKSLDIVIRVQLDPIWHTLSMTARQLVSDLKILRQCLNNLTQYDCVTFLKFVDSLRSSERKFGQNVGWLFLESADNLFVNARLRVYGDHKPVKKQKSADGESGTVKQQFEENPKWKVVKDLLDEIRKENEADQTGMGAGKTLIAASDDWTCCQLKDYLCEGGQTLLSRIHEKSLLQPDTTTSAGQQTNKSTWKDRKDIQHYSAASSSVDLIVSQAKIRSSRRSLKQTQANNEGEDDSGSSSGGRTSSLSITQILREDHEDDDTSTHINTPNQFGADSERIEDYEALPPEAYYGFITSPLTVIHPLQGCSDPYSLQRTLEQVRPRYVILYDPEIQFVRQLEVYKASNPHLSVRVYFIMFDSSVEEQRYLTTLRKEKESFETLIRQKASMVVTEGDMAQNQFDDEVILDSRKAGQSNVSTQQSNVSTQHKIIVDMREFRSELPSLIHRRGIDIEPVTVEVGDYILTPDICVERKSVSDLIGSLNNGRLYNQALSMTRHYKHAILLIEFDHNKSFALQTRGSLSSDISSNDVTSRLTLLTLHFPKLRIIWSPNAYATAEIFAELKAGKPQPSAEAAIAVTGDGDSNIPPSPSDKYSHVHQDLILKLPGINSKNYKYILNNVSDLKELCTLSEGTLTDILGNNTVAKQITEFLHKQHTTETQPSTSTCLQTLDKKRKTFKRKR